MDHEFEEILREADEFIAEMEMDIEERRSWRTPAASPI